MNSLLLDLALRGTLVSLVVLLLDAALDRYQQPQWRKLWWRIVPLAWILPFHLPHRGSIPSLPLAMPFNFGTHFIGGPETGTANVLQSHTSMHWGQLAMMIWLAGAVISFLVVGGRTVITSRRWSGVRLCTDPELLELLEDCKSTAGVSAPIGLVLTPNVSSPALLGWLRPRILLPETLAHSISREELRGVFLHELAHFRSADIPVHWLFSLGLSLHWFNPVAHFATRRWMYFRELTADATALSWMPAESRDAYGDALIAAVREANPLPIPRGALALGESFQQLKLRITMIAHNQSRARLVWLATVVSVLLASAVLLPRTVFAEESSDVATLKSAAGAAGDTWLKLLDEGNYAGTWETASTSLKSHGTAESWVAKCKSARIPAGTLISRKLASAAYQKDPIGANGVTQPGEFVIEEFESSYENLKFALEKVALTKEPDGEWRVFGYTIKPK